jgi:hypothetical protein
MRNEQRAPPSNGARSKPARCVLARCVLLQALPGADLLCDIAARRNRGRRSAAARSTGYRPPHTGNRRQVEARQPWRRWFAAIAIVGAIWPSGFVAALVDPAQRRPAYCAYSLATTQTPLSRPESVLGKREAESTPVDTK